MNSCFCAGFGEIDSFVALDFHDMKEICFGNVIASCQDLSSLE